MLTSFASSTASTALKQRRDTYPRRGAPVVFKRFLRQNSEHSLEEGLVQEASSPCATNKNVPAEYCVRLLAFHDLQYSKVTAVLTQLKQTLTPYFAYGNEDVFVVISQLVLATHELFTKFYE